MTPKQFQTLLNQNADFEDEIASLYADAMRYRWLRDTGSRTWDPLQRKWMMTAAECDAAIDRGIEP